MFSRSVRIALLFLTTVMVHAQRAAPLNKTEIQKIDSIFSGYVNKPGCAVAVVKNGEILFQKGYGLANLEYGIPVTSQTVFEAPAVAKQCTAACIFLLMNEGKLHLDDPLQKFFPDFPAYPEGPLSVKNLLYQTSGLRSYLAILYGQNRFFGDQLDNEEVLRMVMNQRNLNFEPGTRNDYSNTNYALLASIVEQVSGQKFASYAKQNLFDPLQMTHTFFKDNPNMVIANRAFAYQAQGDHFELDHFFNPAVVGDGGLHTSLEDMIKWSDHLSTGTIGGKELLAQLITPSTLNSGRATTYAGGVYLRDHYDIEGLPTIRHSGIWAGFRSLYYQFLNQEVSFIILSNNGTTNVWELLDQLTPFFVADDIAQAQELATSDTQARAATKKLRLTRKEKERFIGNFYNTIDGSLRRIELNDKQLFYKRLPDGPSSPLTIWSSTELRFEAAPFIGISYDTSHKTMTFAIEGQDPIPFERYQEASYDQAGLGEYEHQYFNEDLEVTYEIRTKGNQLQVLIEGKELVLLTPFAEDMFREEHFGYLTFQRDVSGTIKSFSRTDNTFANLFFHRIKKS